MRINPDRESSGPLAGVRVLDLSTIVSGPLCAQILGDLGADVIKLEPPRGDSNRYLAGSNEDGLSGYFAQSNRNKRSAWVVAVKLTWYLLRGIPMSVI